MPLFRRAIWLFSLTLAACLAPPSPVERASQATRQLNLATRFGRMDLAINRTTPEAREEFIKHHAAWGREIRILDVELTSMSLPESDRAEVVVDFSWTRSSESTLRTTRVHQDWHDTRGGWLLGRERRISGDLGLFGEAIPEVTAEPRRDVQFKTKVIPSGPLD